MKLLAALAILAALPLVLCEFLQQEVLSSSKGSSQNLNLVNWASSNVSLIPNHEDLLKAWFRFDPNDHHYTNPADFVRAMYSGHDPWINVPANNEEGLNWMVECVGKANLRVDSPVRDPKNPNWRWADVYRPLNVYHNLINIAHANRDNQESIVGKYLSRLPTKDDDLATALFPQAIRDLLVDNDKIIMGSSEPWVGKRGGPVLKDEYKAFPGVKVTYAADTKSKSNSKPKPQKHLVEFTQTGAIGPMSLEASFILATQLAGINWRTLGEKIDDEALAKGVYWAGALMPEKHGEISVGFGERTQNNARKGRLGLLKHAAKTHHVDPALGSASAGFYLVLDIDLDDVDATEKKLFVFAGQLIDPHSRVYVSDEKRLHDMSYATPVVLNDEQDEKGPKKGPKKPEEYEPPQVTGKNGDNTRYYSHAHSAIYTSKEWTDWINERSDKDIPDYIQIGKLHLYFLPEDEDSLWPRQGWIGNNRCPN